MNMLSNCMSSIVGNVRIMAGKYSYILQLYSEIVYHPDLSLYGYVANLEHHVTRNSMLGLHNTPE